MDYPSFLTGIASSLVASIIFHVVVRYRWREIVSVLSHLRGRFAGKLVGLILLEGLQCEPHLVTLRYSLITGFLIVPCVFLLAFQPGNYVVTPVERIEVPPENVKTQDNTSLARPEPSDQLSWFVTLSASTTIFAVAVFVTWTLIISEVRLRADRSLVRILAIASKDEARRIAVAQANVTDRTTLLSYCSAMADLSRKYGLPVGKDIEFLESLYVSVECLNPTVTAVSGCQTPRE